MCGYRDVSAVHQEGLPTRPVVAMGGTYVSLISLCVATAHAIAWGHAEHIEQWAQRTHMAGEMQGRRHVLCKGKFRVAYGLNKIGFPNNT